MAWTNGPGVKLRQELLVAGAASCAIALGLLFRPQEPSASPADATSTLFAATTGDHSELIEVLPITRRPAQAPRVVISLGPADLPRLEVRDTLHAFAEVQATTTCVDHTNERCIGRPYEFSPFVSAKLLLAGGERVTGGRLAVALAHPKSVHCGQRRPNRNHHCVLTFQHARKRIRNVRALPCPPSRCFLNLVLSAHNRRAQRGNVVVIGADRPNGSVGQDKGRLSAVVTKAAAAAPSRSRTARRVHRRLPVTLDNNATPVYSIEFSNLRRGDVLVGLAKQRTSISAVPYNVFIGTRIVLTERRSGTSASPLARRVSSLKGHPTEGNGFNCTHGPSAYRSPCTSRKAGLVEIRRTPMRNGHPVPLFVNLVAHTRPKLAPPRSGDHINVLPSGHLTVRRYASDRSSEVPLGTRRTSELAAR
jgi:hypothetical protein